MSVLKILLSLFLFLIAILPVFIKSEDLYNNNATKIFVTILLLLILVVNILIVIAEKKDSNLKEREKEELLKFTSELENYIDSIEISLHLDQNYRFEELHPIYFGYEFNVFNKKIRVKEVLVTNNSFRDKDVPFLGYKIYDANHGGKTINSTFYGVGTKVINRLHSKIYFPPNKYTLRDLNKGLLMVYITKNLVPIVREIILSINDWIVIKEKISPKNWEKLNDISKVATWDNYGLQMKEYYRISPQFTQTFNYHPWQIDLFNRKIIKRRPG